MNLLLTFKKNFLNYQTEYVTYNINKDPTKQINFFFINKISYNLNFFFPFLNNFCIFYLNKNKNSYFWIVNKKYIPTYISILKNFFVNNLKGWFVEIEIKGLGFRIILMERNLYLKKYTKIRFDGGFSHFIDFKLPQSIYIKKKKRKNFLLYGYSIRELHNFVFLLTNFRPIGPYKIRGLKIKKFKIKLKPGKNK